MERFYWHVKYNVNIFTDMALDGVYVGQADIKNLKRYWEKKITIITITAYDIIFPPPSFFPLNRKRKLIALIFFWEWKLFFLRKMTRIYGNEAFLRNAMSGWS